MALAATLPLPHGDGARLDRVDSHSERRKLPGTKKSKGREDPAPLLRHLGVQLNGDQIDSVEVM
jgi:hypothetical protein